MQLKDTINEAHHGRGEVVILVDDEPALVAVTASILEALGYEVRTFVNPTDALDQAILLAQDDNYRLDLLITDVVMPQMFGTELAKHIRNIFPSAKILFITGHDNGLIRQYGQETGEKVNFVKKPCGAKLLAQKVREALNG